MKIVIDIDIPYIKGVFEPFFGEVLYKRGVDIKPVDVKEADALIIRTRTICNKELLVDSKLKVIATATIGTDHIDIDLCKSKGIKVFSSPGCNAGGVLQWVLSALFELSNDTELNKRILGVIGVGRIGKLLVNAAKALGLSVLQCDPPRERIEGGKHFVSFKTLAQECDILSFHVPLTYIGKDATYRMGNENFFGSIKPNAWIINSARGGVLDEKVMLNFTSRINLKIAFDVWENEPHISTSVLKNVIIGTPHIAGYSKEGKFRATVMVVNAVSDFFSINLKNWYPTPNPLEQKIHLDISDLIDNKTINYKKLFQRIYPIRNDDKALRDNPGHFEELRNNYNQRNENCSYDFSSIINETQKNVLEELGFGSITNNP
jgi:erythronate-4-phosphate dehydrogenase